MRLERKRLGRQGGGAKNRIGKLERLVGKLTLEALKEVHLREYGTFEDAVARLLHLIEEAYNRKRLHSAIGYGSPDKFEVTILNDVNHSLEAGTRRTLQTLSVQF